MGVKKVEIVESVNCPKVERILLLRECVACKHYTTDSYDNRKGRYVPCKYTKPTKKSL